MAETGEITGLVALRLRCGRWLYLVLPAGLCVPTGMFDRFLG